MTGINNFNFKNFDIGGADGAVANDGKLTGEEVQKAKNAGWTVWDGFRECDNAESAKNDINVTDFLKTFMEYTKLKEKILKEKLPKLGIFPNKIAGMECYNVDTILFDKRYKKAAEEAAKEAKEQLGLAPDTFSIKIIGQETDINVTKINEDPEITITKIDIEEETN